MKIFFLIILSMLSGIPSAKAEEPKPTQREEQETKCKAKDLTACARLAMLLVKDDKVRSEKLAVQTCKAKIGIGCAALGFIRSDQGKEKEAWRLWELSCKLGFAPMCEHLEKARQEAIDRKLDSAPQVTLMTLLANPKKYEDTLVSLSRVTLVKGGEDYGELTDDPPRNHLHVTVPDDAPQSLREKWVCMGIIEPLWSVQPIIGVYKSVGDAGHVFLILKIKANISGCK